MEGRWFAATNDDIEEDAGADYFEGVIIGMNPPICRGFYQNAHFALALNFCQIQAPLIHNGTAFILHEMARAGGQRWNLSGCFGI